MFVTDTLAPLPRVRAQLPLGPDPLGWAPGHAASHRLHDPGSARLLRLKQRVRREEIVIYERAQPGELLHVDVKPLGRTTKPAYRVTGNRSRAATGPGGLALSLRCHRRHDETRLRPQQAGDVEAAFLDACERFYDSY